MNVAAAVAKPCPECPFNRRVSPGTLGGSPVTTYIGQIFGPFVIACHMHLDFQDPAWRDLTAYSQTPQCAGAAVLRANIGVDVLMPPALPRAQADRTTVFADIAEFTAHHLPDADLPMLRRFLTPDTIKRLVDLQIDRAQRGVKP